MLPRPLILRLLSSLLIVALLGNSIAPLALAQDGAGGGSIFLPRLAPVLRAETSFAVNKAQTSILVAGEEITPTFTPTPPTPTPTPTMTPTGVWSTDTPTPTVTETPTPTGTWSTNTPTPTGTKTPTPIGTWFSPTPTPTMTPTGIWSTDTPTPTVTETPTPTGTWSTNTPTPTGTKTPTPTGTWSTDTPTPTSTETPTPTQASTLIPSVTASNTPTITPTPVTTVIPPDEGGTLTSPLAGLDTSLSVPPGAVSEPISLAMQTVAVAEAPPTGGFSVLGNSFAIEAHTLAGDPVTQFAQPLTIVVRYSDDDLGGQDENGLQIYYWDEAQVQWVAISTAVDPQANTLTAQVDHLTIFAVLHKPGGAWWLYLPGIQR